MTRGAPGPQTWTPGEERRPRDAAARAAGLFLLVTALATVAAVAGRVMADADQATLAESLAAVSESRTLYGIGGAARLVSAIIGVLMQFIWVDAATFMHPVNGVVFVVTTQTS